MWERVWPQVSVIILMAIESAWAEAAEGAHPGGLTSEGRKAMLVDAFKANLAHYGNYEYVAETTVLRPVKDRALYCLFYATRHPRGIEVFRDCQAEALKEQSKTRAATKVRHGGEDRAGGNFPVAA
jgi:hypothetical protein